MSKRFKKIALAIYLDPAQKGPDSFTYETMVEWSQKRKEYAADPLASIELHKLVHIHKDIYLSGLFLHKLKPELAKSLALSLSKESITENVLLDVLKSHQILEHQSASIDSEQLLTSINATIANTLDNREPQVVETAATGFDHTALSSDFEKLLDKKSAEQQKQISELKQLVTMQTKLIHDLVNRKVQPGSVNELDSGTNSGNQAESPIEVEKRLASVQKLKKKGVF